jgi:hypothetical protein
LQLYLLHEPAGDTLRAIAELKAAIKTTHEIDEREGRAA